MGGQSQALKRQFVDKSGQHTKKVRNTRKKRPRNEREYSAQVKTRTRVEDGPDIAAQMAGLPRPQRKYNEPIDFISISNKLKLHYDEK